VDIATLRLPDRNFGGLYTDSKKDVNPADDVPEDIAPLDYVFLGPRKSAV
jgi:hypothetical protein